MVRHHPSSVATSLLVCKLSIVKALHIKLISVSRLGNFSTHPQVFFDGFVSTWLRFPFPLLWFRLGLALALVLVGSALLRFLACSALVLFQLPALAILSFSFVGWPSIQPLSAHVIVIIPIFGIETPISLHSISAMVPLLAFSSTVYSNLNLADNFFNLIAKVKGLTNH